MALPAAIALTLLATSPARAASPTGPISGWASGVPSYISMYIYVPSKPAANPPILVVSHFCGGSASAVFNQAQGGGLVAAADKYGFIMIFPQTTNAASSAKCWDVGSKQSLTHDGGGDTQAVAEMVKYTVTTYGANADRVYATGDSSGAMMTQALLAVYPEVFKAGASFAGVPAGCWSAGWSAASNWGSTCASGNDIMTAAQWGSLARGMYPGYTGHRPRVQLFHGDADPTISFKNFGESIKEWTNILSLSTTPTSTTTGLTLGTHQATRQQWKNACGYVVLDTFQSIGGDHGPSDALFDATYVIPFLGLDQTGPTDPEIAQCGTGGSGGMGGSGGTGGGASGAGGAGGRGGSGGTSGGVGGAATSTGGASGSAGANGGMSGSAGASGGASGSAGANGGASGSGGSGGATASGGGGFAGGAAGSGVAGGAAGSGVAGGAGTPGSGSGNLGGSSGEVSGSAGSAATDDEPTLAASSPGTCACSVPGGSRPGAAWPLSLLALGLLLARRRKERRAS